MPPDYPPAEITFGEDGTAQWWPRSNRIILTLHDVIIGVDADDADSIHDALITLGHIRHEHPRCTRGDPQYPCGRPAVAGDWCAEHEAVPS